MDELAEFGRDFFDWLELNTDNLKNIYINILCTFLKKEIHVFFVYKYKVELNALKLRRFVIFNHIPLKKI